MTHQAGVRSAEDTYALSQIWNSSLGQQFSQHAGSLSHRMGTGGRGWGGSSNKGAEPKAATP